MKVLREVNGIQLNEGNGMANGLFNVSNESDVSLWFDKDEMDQLMSLNDDEFNDNANEKLMM